MKNAHTDTVDVSALDKPDSTLPNDTDSDACTCWRGERRSFVMCRVCQRWAKVAARREEGREAL